MKSIVTILRIGQISAALLIAIGSASIFADSARILTGRPSKGISETSIEAIIYGIVGVTIFYILEEVALNIGLI